MIACCTLLAHHVTVGLIHIIIITKVIGALLDPSRASRRVVEENGWPHDKFVGLNRLFMLGVMSRVEMMMIAIDSGLVLLLLLVSLILINTPQTTDSASGSSREETNTLITPQLVPCLLPQEPDTTFTTSWPPLSPTKDEKWMGHHLTFLHMMPPGAFHQIMVSVASMEGRDRRGITMWRNGMVMGMMGCWILLRSSD